MKITINLDKTDIEKIERFKRSLKSGDNSPEGYKEFIDSARDLAPILTGSYNHAFTICILMAAAGLFLIGPVKKGPDYNIHR